MTLDQMKNQIVELLHDKYKAYELPAICSQLGLAGAMSKKLGRQKEFMFIPGVVSGLV